MLFCTTLWLVSAAETEANDEDGRIASGELAIGLGYLDDDAARRANYSGLTERGLEPLLDFRFAARPVWDSGATRRWYFSGTSVGQQGRQLEAGVGDHNQRFTLVLTQIPRELANGAVTPFQGAGSSDLTLPSGWQAEDETTAGMITLNDNLQAASIREHRRRLSLDYRRNLTTDWQLDMSYRHEARSGRLAVGSSIGSTGGNVRAALLPAPLDHRTDIIDIGVSRHGPRYTLGLGYSGSYFSNDNAALSWQNPFGAHPQWAPGAGFPDGQGRIAMEPDNSAHRLNLSGSYRFTPLTRADLTLNLGRMRQNDAFLPYTVNPQLSVAAPLPRGSLDGRIDTTLLDVGLGTRPLTRLHLRAKYRFDDRDNRTPRAVYRPVSGDARDQVAIDQARINRPYSLTDHLLGVKANYRVAGGLRLDAGYEYTQTDRDYSEVNRVREHSYSAGLRYTGLQTAALSLDYAHERRDAGEYIGNRPLIDTRLPGTVTGDDFENHPLLRKYYLADRDRDRVQIRGDLFVTPQLNLGAALAYNRDDYRNSVFGLNRSTMRSATLDAGFTPDDDIQFTAFFNVDRYSSEQAGRQFNFSLAQALDPERDWWVESRDRFNTFGLNIDLDNIAEHAQWIGRAGLARPLDVGIEMLYTRSRALIDVDSGPALDTEAVPDLYSKLNFYRIHARYRLTERSALQAAWTHERYRSRDFALDATDAGTMATVISLGDRSPHYSVNWITLSWYTDF